MQFEKDPESMSRAELEKLIARCAEADEEGSSRAEFRSGGSSCVTR